MVVLAFDQAFEASDSVFEFHLDTWRASENLSDVKRLRQETLNLPGTCNDQFVFFRQFVHAQDRDDVLQFFVALQDFLNTTSDFIMVLTNDQRIQDTAG